MQDEIQQNQIVAIEKGVKSRVEKAFGEIYKQIQKPNLLNGQIRKFEAINDDGEKYPDENVKVQVESGSVIKKVTKSLTELFDVVATKDWGNTIAKANVVVDGEVLAENVPATYLLFLEKQITDIHTFISKMPTLDPAYDWEKDANSNLYKSNVVKTHKTKKTQKPIVKYDATDKHPAQTELISEDVIIGHWCTTQLSGALPLPRKEELLEKIDKVKNAVKSAREKANSAVVEKKEVGDKILNFIFK